MAKQKLDIKSTDVGAEQNDFEMRWKQANDEVRAILDKYKVDIGARLDPRPEAIVAVPTYIDVKGK